MTANCNERQRLILETWRSLSSFPWPYERSSMLVSQIVEHDPVRLPAPGVTLQPEWVHLEFVLLRRPGGQCLVSCEGLIVGSGRAS